MRTSSSPGPHPQALPMLVDARQPGPRLLAHKHPGVARNPGNIREHLQRRGCQRHHACAGLGITETQFPRRPVHIVPAQGQNLAFPAAGQHQQANRHHRQRPGRAVSLRRVQHPAKQVDFLRRQETFAHPLLVCGALNGTDSSRPAPGPRPRPTGTSWRES